MPFERSEPLTSPSKTSSPASAFLFLRMKLKSSTMQMLPMMRHAVIHAHSPGMYSGESCGRKIEEPANAADTAGANQRCAAESSRPLASYVVRLVRQHLWYISLYRAGKAGTSSGCQHMARTISDPAEVSADYVAPTYSPATLALHSLTIPKY